MRYYKRVNTEGETTTVESYSHNLKVKGAVEITKAEYDAFIASLPVVEPEPVMDYKAEILKLQDEVKKLKEGK